MTPTRSPNVPETEIPLCVDLDGTLIRSDLLWESLFQFIRQHPGRLYSVLPWLFKGRAHLKRQLAENTTLDVALLPFNAPFAEWLFKEKTSGRILILTTAADETLARRVAAHSGIFDDVFASDGTTNLKGEAKAEYLSARFGKNFDYAGNSSSDWEIWRVCRQIIAVETPRRLTRRLEKSGRLTASFRTSKPNIAVWRKALRIHQWIKNALIFVPLIAAHKALDTQRLLPTVICFAAFSLVASATYICNDLLDLASDRVHPKKKFRPVAAGDLSIPMAVAGSVALLAAGIALASLANSIPVALLILFYSIASLVYSVHLKKTALLDVYALSGFYTLRFVAGAAAAQVPLSGWFLSFSVFLFLSLGFAKRAAELHRIAFSGTQPLVPGRGYMATDFQPVMCFGIAAAFSAALVLSLYFQSAEVQALYQRPELLWALLPICLYWLTRVWLLASRGTLHEDPVSFAIKDRITWLIIGLCAIILELSSSGMTF